jgi:hypothetical protein
VASLDAALALVETADARAARGRALALARRFDEAVGDLERALALDGRHALALAVLTAVHVNRGDEVEARRVHAAARAALGPREAADGLTLQLHGLAPDPVAPQEALDRCTRGYVAMLDEDWEYARNELLVGLLVAPRYLWCVAGLGEAMWRAGHPARGEALLRAVIEEYPERQAALRADASARLAELLLEQRRNAGEAAAIARAALAQRGERPGLLALAARACDAAGDAGCATAAWRRLAAHPRAPESLRAEAAARVGALTRSP